MNASRGNAGINTTEGKIGKEKITERISTN